MSPVAGGFLNRREKREEELSWSGIRIDLGTTPRIYYPVGCDNRVSTVFGTCKFTFSQLLEFTNY